MDRNIYNKNEPCMICLDSCINTQSCDSFPCGHWLCILCLIKTTKCPLCDIPIDYKSLQSIGSGYQIFMKNMDCTTTTMIVNGELKCEDFKKYYQLKQHIKQEVRFICGGRQLGDKSLSYYKVSKESTIHVVIMLRGD